MNFFQILSDIEKVDPEVYDRLDSRRRVFKHMAGVGQKLTAAALPLFIGSVFNKVYAQTPAGISATAVLQLAMKLEYLESAFYQLRTSVSSQLSAANNAALALIATDESNHVTFLGRVLGSNAVPVPPAGTFDPTGKGNFPDVLTNAGTYLAVAEALEDTGVRAYKGAAPIPTVMADKTVLTAALNIHSIEARHASHIRSMRRGGSTAALLLSNATPSNSVAVSPYSAQPKSWISGTDGGGPAPGKTNTIYGAGSNTGAPTGVMYLAEDNNIQGGVTLTTSTSTSFANFPTSAFTEAFDEGLDATTVINIANLFSTSYNGVPGSGTGYFG